MQKEQSIFLPAGFKQFRIFKGQFTIIGKQVLVIGAGSEKIAEKMITSGAASAKMIVNDFDSLMNSRLNLKNESGIFIEMMDYNNTDFKNEEFDLIYAQGSISSSNRNKIIKEVRRIIKPDGVFCVGEITSFSKSYPPFIKNIFDSSNISPLLDEDCAMYYKQSKFTVLFEQDLSSSLKNFYENAVCELKANVDGLSGQEKSYYKKLLNKISHESHAYLNLGADKYIGFKMLILKLSDSTS